MMDAIDVYGKSELEEQFMCSRDFNKCSLEILTGQMKSGRIGPEETMFYLETIFPETEYTLIEKLYNTVVFYMICSAGESERERLWCRWKDSFKNIECNEK